MKSEILKLLENDAKLSPAQISVMLDLPLDEVTAAITELESNGTILGYKAIVDWEKTERESVTAMIDVKLTPQKDKGFDRVAEKIYNYPEVKSVYLMSGAYDLSVLIEGKTMKEVAFFVSQKLAPIDEVISTATHFVLHKYKDTGVLYDATLDIDERGNCN
ncbi:MAG: Lrp/AsnC family transcriptional regulator [Clostridia bacterium]|jgi:DNA-binding Lrp family transcriptional regulator|nr:Lrp/AsnC family transcriptional regulator [Clostridia bacterium]MBR4013857.1 Lrp/AsnC family transcriptional regulator [Clostridia bacterium]